MARKIAISGKAAGHDRLKIFISYSRRDAAAADAIVAALTERGFDVTIDTRDLPFGEKWQAELAEFIRLSDTVIWLVSEASIHSHWVNWELDEVARRNKRLVPLMVGLVNPAELPRQLGEIHILPPDRVFDLAQDLGTLVQVLETDHAWLKQASRLQDRAHEWLTKSRASALLLSRGALADAERWKDGRPANAPAPAQEVMDLLLASRQAATRRLRWVVGGSLTAAVVAIGLAGAAYRQSIEANNQRNEAQKQREQAISNEKAAVATRNDALLQQSRFLVARVPSSMGNRYSSVAVLWALEALPHEPRLAGRPYYHEAYEILKYALLGPQEKTVIPLEGGSITALSLSKDGTRILAGSADGRARIREISGKKEIELTGHCLSYAVKDGDCQIHTANFSPSGEFVLTASQDMVKIWTPDGKLVAKFVEPCIVDPGATKTSCGFMSASWSSDGNMIVTSSLDTTAKLWSPIERGVPSSTWSPIVVFRGHGSWVRSASMSPNGKYLLTASDDKTSRIWDLTGRELARLEGHTDGHASAAFSPDGTRVATGSFDRRVRIWERHANVENDGDWKEAATLDGHRGAFVTAFFSSSSEMTIVSSASEGVHLWRLRKGKWNRVAVFEADNAFVVAITPDESTVALGLKDGTIRIFERMSEFESANSSFSQDWDSIRREGDLPLLDDSPWLVFDDIDNEELVERAKRIAARCLTLGEREEVFLQSSVPRWCITGAGLEGEKDSTKWQPKWPYRAPAWRDWLLAKDRGENPELPTAE